MIKCIKCGVENLDNSKFCSNCGAKIEIVEDQYVCSKCGAIVHGKQAFCTDCGSKLIYVQSEEEAFAISKGKQPVERVESKKEEVKQSSPESSDKPLLLKIANIIFSSLIILIAFLGMISVFLPFCKAKASLLSLSVEETKGVKYWFSECWEGFGSTNGWYQIGIIYNFLSFIAGIVLTITFGVIAIVKAVKSLVSRKEKPGMFKAAAIGVVGALQYFIFSAANYVALVETTGVSEGIAPGAGYALAFASLFILIAVVIAKAIIMFVAKNISVKSMIFKCVFPLLVSIVLIVSFTKPFYVAETTSVSVKSYTGIFPILSQLNSYNYVSTRMNFVMAFIVLIALIACSSVWVASVLNKNNRIINVVFSALVFSLLILFTIFGKRGLANFIVDGSSYVSLTQALSTVKVSGKLILGIVLSGLALGGAITQTILEKK